MSSLAIRRIEAAQAQLQSNVVTLSIDMKSYVNAGDLTRIASWLCPPTSYTAQDSLDTALRLRSPDSGKWVFKTLDYTSWLEGREKILWVTGLRKFNLSKQKLHAKQSCCSWLGQDCAKVR